MSLHKVFKAAAKAERKGNKDTMTLTEKDFRELLKQTGKTLEEIEQMIKDCQAKLNGTPSGT